MLQMGGVGPMLGQAHHFLRFNAGKAPYAEQRYAAEAKRLYAVLDARLADREHLSGTYSIADMAIGLGFPATSGRASTGPTTPTSNAGTSPSPTAPPCNGATTCR